MTARAASDARPLQVEIMPATGGMILCPRHRRAPSPERGPERSGRRPEPAKPGAGQDERRKRNVRRRARTGIGPLLPFKIGPVNAREAREDRRGGVGNAPTTDTKLI